MMSGYSYTTSGALWFCHRCNWTGWSNAGDAPHICKDFKVSDTPRSGPEGISGHPGTPGPLNNKEIA